MNWLDLVFAVLVVICGIAGSRVGLIRAAGGALGVVLGILIASQLSGDVGGLYAGYLANETLANMTAYGLIVVAATIGAAVLSLVVRKVVDLMAMGWLDKLAGLGLGLVAGLAITWAAIGGLAGLTYDSDLIDRGVSAAQLEDKADPTQVKATLESALIGSTFVGVVIGATDNLPANALGFVPARFMTALDILEERTGS